MIERLHPTVREREAEDYSLASDLSALTRVWEAEAPEGTILYAARILEALSGDAVAQYGLARSPNAFANLVVLEDFGAIQRATQYWAHALRRLGNEARHIHRRLDVQDAALALLLTEEMLTWYFCAFPRGPRLPAVAADGACVLPVVDVDLSELFHTIGRARESEALKACRTDSPAFHATAALPCIVAERLIDAEMFAAAVDVLAPALERFPADLRLQQLRGLFHSRRGRPGDLERARTYLQSLRKRSGPDEETCGILGGVYKRHWDGENPDCMMLRRAEQAYAEGWANSKGSNPYLGLNAATTALWRGDEEVAQLRAIDVEALLQERWNCLEAHEAAQEAEVRKDPAVLLGYYNVVTLAEARLLLGRTDDACELYRRAFALESAEKGPAQVTRAQARKVWAKLRLRGGFDEKVPLG